VAKLEAGAREPGWRTVLDLAAALGVPVTAFVTADVAPIPAPRRAGGKRK
jgi:transcriptional regulator with XRE-family HTH domain